MATSRSVSRSGGLIWLALAFVGCVEDDPALQTLDGSPFDAGGSLQDAEHMVDGGASPVTDGSETPSLDGGEDAGANDAGTLVDGSMNHDDDAAGQTVPDAGPDTTLPLASPPNYLGTQGASSACTQSYRTLGRVPGTSTAEIHPLFLYFVGTQGGAADESARFDGLAPQQVLRAMAERGFVALAVEYDNALLSFFTDKLPCLYGSDNPQSLLAVACALSSVDCSLGIATWGHSQGAYLAHAAANYDARVRAVWTTGYSGLTGAKLSPSRFRTVNGEAEPMNSAVATANKTAGFAAGECPDDGRDQCLRPDGSGWIVVRKAACKTNAADHCWFNKRSCAESAETLEPNWIDAAAGTPFGLDENADWVARTVARP